MYIHVYYICECMQLLSMENFIIFHFLLQEKKNPKRLYRIMNLKIKKKKILSHDSKLYVSSDPSWQVVNIYTSMILTRYLFALEAGILLTQFSTTSKSLHCIQYVSVTVWCGSSYAIANYHCNTFSVVNLQFLSKFQTRNILFQWDIILIAIYRGDSSYQTMTTNVTL